MEDKNLLNEEKLEKVNGGVDLLSLGKKEKEDTEEKDTKKKDPQKNIS